MRKIFIDAGANDGCSINMFKQLTSDYEEYDIYAFECQPNLYQKLQERFSKNKKINLLSSAVWIEDGKIDFWITGNGSSTVIKKKVLIQKKKNKRLISVKSIDFPQWILDNFSKNDYIILKMDIEGAEYKVLPQMFKTGAIEYINVFYGELHGAKSGNSYEESMQILKELEKYNLMMTNWDGQTNSINQSYDEQSLKQAYASWAKRGYE